MYEELPIGWPRSQPPPGSFALVDLFVFTSPQAGAAGYTTLLADLRSCQSRLRAAQAAVPTPPDAALTELTTANAITAWSVTATGLTPHLGLGGGLLEIYPYVVTGAQVLSNHLVLLILRGPLLEAIEVNIAGANDSAFTPVADVATAAAAAANLCLYDIRC